MDAFDLFGDQEETYRGSLWLWDSTQGVVAPGETHTSAEGVEQQLTSYTRLPLEWTRDLIDDEDGEFAGRTFDEGINLAVVVRVESGDVVSHARLPDGWLPSWHPRAQGSNASSTA